MGIYIGYMDVYGISPFKGLQQGGQHHHNIREWSSLFPPPKGDPQNEYEYMHGNLDVDLRFPNGRNTRLVLGKENIWEGIVIW